MTTAAANPDSASAVAEPDLELDALQWGHLRHIVRLSR